MKKWWKDPKQLAIVSAKISEAVKLKKLTNKKKKPTFGSVFRNKFTKLDNNCWIWKGSKDHKGYGKISLNKKVWSAHRLSYTLSVGNILRDMRVCHSCENPACINPKHLFLGDLGDNMINRIKKELSKLSEENKNKIRNLYKASYSIEDIAKEFNVSYGVVSLLLTNFPLPQN